MATITTTASVVASNSLIQNLGPDTLYVGEGSVSASTGIRVDVGKAIAIGTVNGTLYAVSAGSSDVRVLGRATGVFLASA